MYGVNIFGVHSFHYFDSSILSWERWIPSLDLLPGGGGVLTYVDMRHVPRRRVCFPWVCPYVRVCFGHFSSVLPYLRVYSCTAPNLIHRFHYQYVRYFVQFTFLCRHGRKISIEKCFMQHNLAKIFTCFGILPYIRVCFWKKLILPQGAFPKSLADHDGSRPI